jgi:hypothetical protein
MNHEPLPKEEWTKPEEDQRYLLPVIQQVVKEFNEREKLETATPDSITETLRRWFFVKSKAK